MWSTQRLLQGDVAQMKCPKCQKELNDSSPECPSCSFSIEELDEFFEKPASFTFPIWDEANLLSTEGKKKLASRIEKFSSRTDGQFSVVSVETTKPRLPSEYLFWLFNRLEIGGEKHQGLMVLVAKEERRIEVEIGCGLEHIITDEGSQRILDRHSVDFLKQEFFDEGLWFAVDLLSQVVENA